MIYSSLRFVTLVACDHKVYQVSRQEIRRNEQKPLCKVNAEGRDHGMVIIIKEFREEMDAINDRIELQNPDHLFCPAGRVFQIYGLLWSKDGYRQKREEIAKVIPSQSCSFSDSRTYIMMAAPVEYLNRSRCK